MLEFRSETGYAEANMASAGVSFWLKFRCTECGNCCRDPLLPMNGADLARLVAHTGQRPASIVRFVRTDRIDMDDEPEARIVLSEGTRIMVLRQARGACQFLGDDDRCQVYPQRPLGCRVFPFDPTFTQRGKLRRLQLIEATDCPYELDGNNDPDRIVALQRQLDQQTEAFYTFIKRWNRNQQRRRREGLKLRGRAAFLTQALRDSSGS